MSAHTKSLDARISSRTLFCPLARARRTVSREKTYKLYHISVRPCRGEIRRCGNGRLSSARSAEKPTYGDLFADANCRFHYFVRICARTSLALSSGQKPGKVGCKMNKNILKAMTVGLMCLTLCGTSLAAPGTPSARRAPRKAPVHQRTPEPRSERTRHAPTRHRARRAAQSKPAPRPAPAPRHPAPRPAPRHHRDSRPADAANWLTFGAAVLGGIVGGLIGAGS